VTEEAAVALRVVSMSELRLAVLVESERTRETVAEVCRRYGISRPGPTTATGSGTSPRAWKGSRTKTGGPTAPPAQIDPELQADLEKLPFRVEVIQTDIQPESSPQVLGSLGRRHEDREDRRPSAVVDDRPERTARLLAC